MPRAWLTSGMETSGIEYTSALVLYLDMDVSEVDERGESLGRIIVAKSRRGRVGFVGVRLHGPSGSFAPDDEAVNVIEARADRRDAEDDAEVMAALKTQSATKEETPGLTPRPEQAARRRRCEAPPRPRPRRWAQLERPNARGQQRKTAVLSIAKSFMGGAA